VTAPDRENNAQNFPKQCSLSGCGKGYKIYFAEIKKLRGIKPHL
jgi:hypothetical protein